jgi:ABC-type nitrate/sulfonate/bicarbonate transport system substrate-binding protein
MDPLHRERLVQIKPGGVPAEPPSEAEEPVPPSAPRPSVASRDHAAELGPDELLAPFTPEEIHALTERWLAAQTAFVEAPHHAVELADQLVGEVIDHLAAAVDEERAALRRTLDEPQPSTEALRLAMRRFHALFERLLALP